MVMNAFQTSHSGAGQFFLAGGSSEVNCNVVPRQWMTANPYRESISSNAAGAFYPGSQPGPQALLCGAMVGNSGPVCMPLAWPIGQTPEGGMMFASVVPPPHASALAKRSTHFVNSSPSASMENCKEITTEKANPNHTTSIWKEELRGPAYSRRLQHGNPSQASSDALTSEEIEEMRLAVQKTFRKMQDTSLSDSLGSLKQKVTRIAGARYASKSKDRDSDTLSSSSSTCIPESSHELGDNTADEDAHTSLGYLAKAETTAGYLSISDSDVDQMLLEMEYSSSDRRKTAVEWVVDNTGDLAFTRRGCRIVQRAMELATSADKQQIVKKLEGQVLEALQSPHANYVLQKCFEIASPDNIQFVLRELKGQGFFVARHRFGCRVLQRALEHCSSEETEELIAEVLTEAQQLVRHTYGNFVIQHILQYGTSSQVHQIAEVLLADAIRFAKHRIASHVMSCALSCCSHDDVQKLTEALSGAEGQLADLMRRHYGSFVVREVVRVNSSLRDVTKK